MNADQRFADWLAQRRKRDKHGHVYQYHPRSDAHSKALCEFIVEDLLGSCTALHMQALDGLIAYGINLGYVWPNGKKKNLDLAIGRPKDSTLTVPQHDGRTVGSLPLSTPFTACHPHRVWPWYVTAVT